jgi:hypothetical protein
MVFIRLSSADVWQVIFQSYLDYYPVRMDKG